MADFPALEYWPPQEKMFFFLDVVALVVDNLFVEENSMLTTIVRRSTGFKSSEGESWQRFTWKAKNAVPVINILEGEGWVIRAYGFEGENFVAHLEKVVAPKANLEIEAAKAELADDRS